MLHTIRLFEYVRACRDATTSLSGMGLSMGLQGTRSTALAIGGTLQWVSPEHATGRTKWAPDKVTRFANGSRDYRPANPRGNFYRPIFGTDPLVRSSATRPAGPGDLQGARARAALQWAGWSERLEPADQAERRDWTISCTGSVRKLRRETGVNGLWADSREMLQTQQLALVPILPLIPAGEYWRDDRLCSESDVPAP